MTGADGAAMLELKVVVGLVVDFESCAETEEVGAAVGCTDVGASMVAVAWFCVVGRRIRRWGFFVVVAEPFFNTPFPSLGIASGFVWGVLNMLDAVIPLSAATADWGCVKGMAISSATAAITTAAGRNRSSCVDL
jgi:hypothetical protein